jgi:hypothetical protein
MSDEVLADLISIEGNRNGLVSTGTTPEDAPTEQPVSVPADVNREEGHG